MKNERCIECGKYPFCKKIKDPQSRECKNLIKKPKEKEKRNV